MKKRNTRLATAEEKKENRFQQDEIVLVFERKGKGSCSTQTKFERTFDTMEELQEKYNILTIEEFKNQRTKQYKSNFR